MPVAKQNLLKLEALVLATRPLLIAATLSGIGVFLLVTYLGRLEAEISGGPKQSVLVVLRALSPGEQIKHSDLAEREVPEAYVPTRSVRSSDRQKVTGLRVNTALQAQDQLLWSDVAGLTDQNRNVSTLIQPGMRAYVIQAAGRAAQLVQPGDRVDVVGTFTQQESSEHRVSAVLLQNVLVLARGSAVQGSASTSPEGRELALSVSLAQSQILAAASDRGTLSVALRSPEDVNVQDGVVDVNSRIFAEPERRAAIASGPSGPARMDALR
jgi:pilus assembly protein CpaB